MNKSSCAFPFDPVRLFILCLLLPAALIITSPGLAADLGEDADQPSPTPIVTWLQLGPTPVPLPAFGDTEEKGYNVEDLLAHSSLEPRVVRPRAGDILPLSTGQTSTWRETATDDGSLTLTATDESPAETYLAVYLEVDRWMSLQLELATSHPVKAYLDGEEISLATKDDEDADDVSGDKEGEGAAKSDQENDAAGKIRAEDAATNTAPPPRHHGELKMAIGKHLLLVHTVFDPEEESVWSLAGQVSRNEETEAEALTVTSDPLRAVIIHDILDAPRIRSLDLSPDGKLVAVTLSDYGADAEQDSWVEIRRARDGGLERTWRGDLGISHLSWAPNEQRLSYTTTKDEKSTIWLFDLASGVTTILVRGVEKLGSYQWAPDGTFLIYSFTIEVEPDDRKVKRVENPADRQPWWRNRSYLVQATLPGGATRRLTAGPLSATGWSISPDSKRLLFFRSEPDLTRRPYSTTELWELDLASLEAELILNDRWINAAAYGPDRGVIALQGSPSAFDDLGLTLPEGVQPNDYGGQLYLFDLKSRQPRAVSRDLDPDINSIWWSLADGRIYALCTDTQYRRLYTYDPRRENWKQLDTGCDVTSGFDLARDAKIAVAYGTSVSTPNHLTAIDLKKGSWRLLDDPGAKTYRDVTCGKVDPWSCVLPGGERLDGRVYYPRNYNPARKYPVIVYYYGGTSPVTRDYGGRYPKNIWAGQDYFVYVPEPSGATGYGQEFAARHVNDWGHRTAGEVIAGTTAFLAAHTAADPERVGCIGASYGGFLTMYLVTQTDIYSAAVSHAGISNITSYWGAGFWGYAYGARALAHSFPWSHQELYVNQSPLFSADKIHTPLLLVHGSADTNVPVGESISLFTALKLLGREVEFVRIEGQNHWILDRDQRIVWNDTIMAFFAKWLKERPAWWEELYPETKAKKETGMDPSHVP